MLSYPQSIDVRDGYPAARTRLITGIEAAKKTNVVVLTGDIHLGGVGTVTTGPERRPVATEFVGTSIEGAKKFDATKIKAADMVLAATVGGGEDGGEG